MEVWLGHIRAAFTPKGEHLYVCKCRNTQEILLPKTYGDIRKLRMMEEKHWTSTYSPTSFYTKYREYLHLS